MLRTALLGGNSITLDADMSKYIETLSDQGVIEGLEVSSGSVAPGKAWVKATRSNGETIMVLVQNTEVLAVDTSGTKKIWLEIRQEAIDNGALNNEDGTGIASIKTGPTLPSQNSLLLASVNNGRVEDARAMIPKIQSVAQRTTSLEQKMETQEQKVERLEEAGTPQFLGKILTVGESYSAGDVMYDDNGTARKKIISYSFDLTPSFNNGNRNVGEFSFPTSQPIRIEIDELKIDSADAHIVFANRYFTSIEDFNQNKSSAYYTIAVQQTHQSYSAEIQATDRVFVSIVSQWKSYNKVFRCTSAKLIQDRSPESPSYYPRSIVGVGQKVECTLLGLHSDGILIQPKLREIMITKEMAGTFTTTRTAPADGYLDVSYKMGVSSSQYGRIRIGDDALPHSQHNTTKRIFIKKGRIELRGGGSEGYQVHTWLRLDKFICIM